MLLFFSSLVSAQTASIFDLVNLKLFASGDVAAYEKIKIVEAWEKINQEKASNPALSLSRVFIGIFDTGIDIIHPEFVGVSIDSTLPEDMLNTFLCTPPFCGHGTQVAGIIGANNISSSGQYVPPQMNGILSGVKDLPYALRIRASGDLASFTLKDSFRQFIELDRLARTPGGLHIINGSFGEPLCSQLTIAQKTLYFINDLSCYKQEEFLAAKDIYSDLVNQYSNVLFVFGAGNDGIDVQFNLPGGGIVSSNVITVGATNLTDGRALFGSPNESNFGTSVNISAPGEKIYAPAPIRKGNFPQDVPQNQRDYDNSFGGTSASASMVTGVAGLIKAIKPDLTPAQIKSILIKTENTDPVVTDPDKPIGRRLNALKAVCDPLVLDCAPPPAAPVWPMLQKDAQRTGLADVAGPPFATSTEVNVKWQKYSALVPPLIGGDGTVYYVDFENKLTAVDGETGTVKRQTLVPGSAFSSAIGPDGTLYVCSNGSTIPGTLTAFDPTGGQEKWRFVVGGPRPCLNPSVAEDGTIYTSAPPVQNAQTAVAVAINPDGTQKWRYEEFNFSASPPTLSRDESQVYVAFNNRLLAFDAKTGLILWERVAPLSFLALPVVDPEERIFIVGPPSFAGGPAILHAFTKSGAPLWQFNTFGLHSIVLAPGTTIVAAHESIIHFIDRATGTLISSVPLPLGHVSVPHPVVDASGLIYLILQNTATFRNSIVAFDGNGMRWQLDIPSLGIGGNGISINRDGVLYFATGGLLTALGL